MITSYHQIEEDTTDLSTGMETELNTVNTDDHHDNAVQGRSIYKGVYKCGKKFKAQIQIERVQHYLGLFDSEIEAAVAYDNHARILLGKRARTNFVYNATASNEDEDIMSQQLLEQQNSSIQRMETKTEEGENKSTKRKRGYAGMQFRPLVDTLRSDEIVAQQPHWERNLSMRRYDEDRISPSSSRRSPKNTNSPKRSSTHHSPGNSPQTSPNSQSQDKSISRPHYSSLYGQNVPVPGNLSLDYNPATTGTASAAAMRGISMHPYHSSLPVPPSLPTHDMALWEQRTNQLSYMYGMPRSSPLKPTDYLPIPSGPYPPGRPTDYPSIPSRPYPPGRPTDYPSIPSRPYPYPTQGFLPSDSWTDNTFMANERSLSDRCDRTSLAISLRMAAAAASAQSIAAAHSTATLTTTAATAVSESSKSTPQSVSETTTIKTASSSPPTTTTTEAAEDESTSTMNKRYSTYWAGVLYIDPVSELQVWKGTYVECSDSTARPTPMEFAVSTNIFEYFTISNHTISTTSTTTNSTGGSSSGNNNNKSTRDSLIQNPQSGTMLGSYLNPPGGSGSLKAMLESQFTLKFQIINECNIHNRRYSASGNGKDDYGTYTIKGVYSTTSRVLELRKQYLN